MPSRPGIVVYHDDSGAGNEEATVQVYADSIRVYCGGPGGPQTDLTVEFSSMNGVGPLCLQAVVNYIRENAPGFWADLAADSAGYNMGTWLDVIGPLDVFRSQVTLNMTTAYVTKNPTVPAVGKVVTPTAFGDGGTALTGTRVDCATNKALTTSGNYGDPAAPLVGTVLLRRRT